MIKLEKEQTARFAARLEQETQESVMRDIAQFSEADIVDTWASEPPACAEVHAMVFNMERGVHIDEAIEFLKDNPSLQPFDLILANELDFGTARSGEKNTAEEVAKALGLSYVFGLEFIELKDAALGFHGNAVFSRWPVKWAEVLRLPEQYNWYNDRQKRIGGRCAILAKLDVHGREVGVASIHLENRTDGEGRRVQMQAVLDEVQRVFAGLPVILGGDLNTNTFDGNDIPGFTKLFNDPERLAKHMAAVEKYERVLPQAEENGFSYREFSSTEGTRRKPMPGGKSMLLKLDWLMARGMECVDHGTVSTETKDCTWAEPGSALAKFTGPELSDHNACWADCRFVK